MKKAGIAIFAGVSLLFNILFKLFMDSRMVYTFSSGILPGQLGINQIVFANSAALLLCGIFSVLLSLLILSRPPRPAPVQKRTQKRVAVLTICTGFYAGYRLIWIVCDFVQSFIREIGLAKSLAVPILSAPLEFLCGFIADWVGEFLDIYAIHWILAELLPMCVLSAAIFTALYGVSLLRKAPAQTAV